MTAHPAAWTPTPPKARNHDDRWRASPMPESETPMPDAVVVWSKPACVQCVATKRKLDQYGIPYIERDLTEHVGQAEEFRNAGYATAPVVVTPRGTWAGFQLDRIKGLRDD